MWPEFWIVYSAHPFMWGALMFGAVLLAFWRPLSRWVKRIQDNERRF